jgi:hypothetical protein
MSWARAAATLTTVSIRGTKTRIEPAEGRGMSTLARAPQRGDADAQVRPEGAAADRWELAMVTTVGVVGIVVFNPDAFDLLFRNVGP